MNKPLVSVAITTYNHENFITETIESILNQTYDNFEIVVGEDCSIDSTRKTLINYKQILGNKLRLILHEKNIGAIANAFSVLKECKGKYIAFLDGDDLFLPQKLEKQVEYMEKHKDVALCYHNVQEFDSRTGKILRLYNECNSKVEGDVELFLKYPGFCATCSIMARKNDIPIEVDKRLKYIGDWFIWIKTCLNGYVAYIDSVLSKRRIHDNNITKIMHHKEALEDRMLILELVKNDIKNKELINRCKAFFYYNYAISCILNDDNDYKAAIRISTNAHYLGVKQLIISILSLINMPIVYKLYKLLRK